MQARVVGGRAALLVAALIACENRSNAPLPSDEPDDLRADLVPFAPVEIAPEAPTLAAPAPEAPLKVVLVTLDGVRWEDILGETPETSTEAMPNLHRLVRERGTAFGGAGCAHDVRTHGSTYVSFPGYLEMFTGKPTTCTHNYCPPVDKNTFVDEARRTSHRAADVAVFASWNRYGHATARDRKSIVMSSGAHTIGLPVAKEDAKIKSLLDFGSATAGYPGYGDYRADANTARIALRYLETKTPRLLVMGLGDADEQAHRGDTAGYKRAIARSDEILGDLEQTLSRMGIDGERTAVLVTTDHGRAHSLFSHGANSPESARVFFAAFGAGIQHRGVACAPEDLKLTHLAGAVRSLLGIESESAPGPLAEAILTSDPASRNVR